jgi:hypothetical protein
MYNHQIILSDLFSCADETQSTLHLSRIQDHRINNVKNDRKTGTHNIVRCTNYEEICI